MSDRPTYEEFKLQLLEENSDYQLFKSSRFYESYLNGLIADLKNLNFTHLIKHLSDIRDEYISPDNLFFKNPDKATLTFKPLDSVYNKMYRLNILKPKNWPPPENYTNITAGNFHEKLDDFCRTRFVCRYLDGPQFVCQKLVEKCQELGIEHNCRAVTTPLGYHAWHFYFKQPIDDFAGNGPAIITIELQFTTQLAEAISSLTHVQYESSRLGEKFDHDWRWNVNSKQFRPYYIAHGLHLLEGVILEFRNSIFDSAEPIDPEPTDIELEH